MSDKLQRDFTDLRFTIRYISRQLEEAPEGAPLPSILTVVLLIMVELGGLEESDLKGTEAGRLALAMLKAVGAGHSMETGNWKLETDH